MNVLARLTCTSCGKPMEPGAVETLAAGYSLRMHLLCGSCGREHALTTTLRPMTEETP